MKNFFKSKKLILSGVFTVLVLSIFALNVTVFPQFLKLTPDVSEAEKVQDEQIDVEETSDVAENIISESEAIEIAKKNIKDEIGTKAPETFDIDAALPIAKYVDENDESPTQESVWYIAFVNSDEDNTSCSFEKPSVKYFETTESETEAKVIDYGFSTTFSFSDKITQAIIAEVNAITGDYYGYAYFITTDYPGEGTAQQWINELHNIDIDSSVN